MSQRREQLELDLVDACQGQAALWFSAGKDSRLLFEILRALRLPFALVRFDHGWTREQQRVVHDVTVPASVEVYCYPPTATMLMGDGKTITMAAAYAVGKQGGQFTILRDLVDGERCGKDLQVELAKQSWPPMCPDTVIVGSKATDRHYVSGQPVHEKSFTVAGQKVLAPLYGWTDTDVLEELQTFGIDYQEPVDHLNTGNIPCCHACLKGDGKVYCPKLKTMIPSVKWDPRRNTDVWRERFMVVQ